MIDQPSFPHGEVYSEGSLSQKKGEHSSLHQIHHEDLGGNQEKDLPVLDLAPLKERYQKKKSETDLSNLSHFVKYPIKKNDLGLTREDASAIIDVIDSKVEVLSQELHRNHQSLLNSSDKKVKAIYNLQIQAHNHFNKRGFTQLKTIQKEISYRVSELLLTPEKSHTIDSWHSPDLSLDTSETASYFDLERTNSEKTIQLRKDISTIISKLQQSSHKVLEPLLQSFQKIGEVLSTQKTKPNKEASYSLAHYAQRASFALQYFFDEVQKEIPLPPLGIVKEAEKILVQPRELFAHYDVTRLDSLLPSYLDKISNQSPQTTTPPQNFVSRIPKLNSKKDTPRRQPI